MPKGKRESFLLDTHIWIWLINGDRRLTQSSLLKRIEQAAELNHLFVSVISAWEVGMLQSKGRIALPYSPLEWVHRALKAPGISLVPLSPKIAVESTQFSEDFPGDPADRILVASARYLGATLVTEDKRINGYAKSGNLKTTSMALHDDL